MQYLHTDFLVIGSGVAGLSFALRTAKASPSSKITILTKNAIGESNTRYAQGGLAAVTDQADSFEKHISDTLAAGVGLCNPDVVRIVVEESPLRLYELISWGAGFDKNADSSLHLAREGGHGKRRIVHRADHTGLEIEQTLVRQVYSMKNIEVREHHLCTDLHVQEGRVSGTWAIDCCRKELIYIRAGVTVIAAGGVGQVYKNTTNPLIATGDGIAMAWRAGASVSNMEYIQFHPTALFTGEKGPLFLISEAVRGAGARLVNKNGERFMSRYSDMMELACRDVVSRAIHREMQLTRSEHVWLDCRGINKKEFQTGFPTILEKCLAMGIDPFTHRVPVVPAAHYCCGGINTDLFGKTNLTSLYAIGESACTGLHGANRLASNSLPEALVFAARASRAAIGELKTHTYDCALPQWPTVSDVNENETEADKETLQALMSKTAIICTDSSLNEAYSAIKTMHPAYSKIKNCLSEDFTTMRNLACVAALILDASLRQTENRGAFFKAQNERDKISGPDTNPLNN